MTQKEKRIALLVTLSARTIFLFTDAYFSSTHNIKNINTDTDTRVAMLVHKSAAVSS